ncbi:MAG: type II secretion system minor pseudopilin GspJ [Gammaproteobacteria bacterium]|nr:MAG: type II secretion system minor pseudopilin GspJ [Gammaproteobacteria bacterium]
MATSLTRNILCLFGFRHRRAAQLVKFSEKKSCGHAMRTLAQCVFVLLSRIARRGMQHRGKALPRQQLNRHKRAGCLPNSAGFTLLELLVALSIFSIVAVLAYGGLDNVLEQRVRTEESAERLAAMQRTYLIIQRDIEQLVPRTIRDEFGDNSAALTGSSEFQLTRGGWQNPLQNPRSTLQRVGYVLEDRKLVRHSWLVLDRAQDSEPRQQVLVQDIVNVRVRYLDPENNWQEQWPTSEQLSGDIDLQAMDPPRAVEMLIEHEHYGEIRWLFQLPA